MAGVIGRDKRTALRLLKLQCKYFMFMKLYLAVTCCNDIWSAWQACRNNRFAQIPSSETHIIFQNPIEKDTDLNILT